MGETAKNWLDVLAESIIKSRWRYYIFLTSVLILILTWFLVSFVWPISDTRYDYTKPSIEIPNTTQNLRVDYPLVLRYGGPPAELRLTRWTTDTLGTLSKPLTVSLSLSPHIVLVNEDSPFIDSSVVFSSTTAQTQVLKEAAQTFKMIPLAGTILTKLDEAVSLGESLGVVINEKIKLAYITDGQRVPEDLHLADPVRLINKAVDLGDEETEDWVTAMTLNQG